MGVRERVESAAGTRCVEAEGGMCGLVRGRRKSLRSVVVISSVRRAFEPTA